MKTIKTDYFYKIANQWFCKQCFPQSKSELLPIKTIKQTAQWLDELRSVLYCPVCGRQEEINKT